MAIFIVRNSIPFTRYVRQSWGYFLNNKREGVNVIIRKGNTFIHISQYYCVICNDLKYLQQHNMLKASKKSMEWLDKYTKY